MNRIIYLFLIMVLFFIIGCEKVDYAACEVDSDCILFPENGRSACKYDFEGVAINKNYRGEWVEDKFSDLKNTKCATIGKYVFINKKAICENNVCTKVDSVDNSTSYSEQAEKAYSLMNLE